MTDSTQAAPSLAPSSVLPAPSQKAPAACSLQDAAALLGVSLNTLRRRIAAGEVRAERIKRPQGHVWRVYLPGQLNGAQHADGDGQHANGTVQDAGSTLQPPAGTVQQHPPASDRGLVALLERAQDDIRRLNDERAELYGRLGYLQAQLAAKDERIKALEAPKEPIAAPPPAGAIFRPLPSEPEPPRRPWWRFW